MLTGSCKLVCYHQQKHLELPSLLFCCAHDLLLLNRSLQYHHCHKDNGHPSAIMSMYITDVLLKHITKCSKVLPLNCVKQPTSIDNICCCFHQNPLLVLFQATTCLPSLRVRSFLAGSLTWRWCRLVLYSVIRPSFRLQRHTCWSISWEREPRNSETGPDHRWERWAHSGIHPTI